MTTTTQLPRSGASDGHDVLLARVRAGDSHAFDELVSRFRSLVHGVARRTGVNATDVDDVAQEVWLTLLGHLDQIDTPACLPGWLKRVTYHAAVRHGRRQNRTVTLHGVPEVPIVGVDDDFERVLAASDGDALREALTALAPTERRMLELLVQDSRPDYARISALVGRPIGSLGPTRQRLLTRLRCHPSLVRARPHD